MSEDDAGLGPVLRTLITLPSRSNQNGAPIETAIAVKAHPINTPKITFAPVKVTKQVVRKDNNANKIYVDVVSF